MCLTAKSTVKTAKKDIVCYKWVDSFFRTPFKNFLYKKNKLYKAKMDESYGCYSSVNIGLHSYSSLQKAIKRSNSYVLLKCIIPKGSKYYIGNFGSFNNSYCSNQLVAKSIVKSTSYYSITELRKNWSKISTPRTIKKVIKKKTNVSSTKKRR